MTEPGMPRSPHPEQHRSGRSGWLRAAVLGANDGIVSTAGLVIGVAAADASRSAVVTAGIAGVVAGAISMAAGEYVSVSSQRDTEEADLAIEARAIARNRDAELRELAQIYAARGVEPGLARLVAEQLMAADEVGAHARDELGITETGRARPIQAAWTSALAFTLGALLPLLAAGFAPAGWVSVTVATVTLLALGGLGALGARLGGATAVRGVGRVVFWGATAMLVTFGVGSAVGATI